MRLSCVTAEAFLEPLNVLRQIIEVDKNLPGSPINHHGVHQYPTQQMHYNQFSDLTATTSATTKSTKTTTTKMPEANNNHAQTTTPQLYHVILTISHLHHDPNSLVDKLRVLGTYSDLKHARAAAHRCLFEAGFRREWFESYEATQSYFEEHNISQRTGLEVLAVEPNGTTYRAQVLSSPNTGGFESVFEDGRIPDQLFHVMRTTVEYGREESGEVRDTGVEGTFVTYEQARDFAGKALLSGGVGKEKEKGDFAEWNEAAEGERDCGYGENVIVHAVGNEGENYLVSIVLGRELESVRLAEASMRIR